MEVRNIIALAIAALCFVSTSAGAQTNNGTAISYAGKYSGIETLDGKRYPIKIEIKENGRITIIDIDNVRGSSKMKGDSFVIRRSNPSQVFEGQVKGNRVTGITYGNRFLGDGTFSATKK